MLVLVFACPPESLSFPLPLSDPACSAVRVRTSLHRFIYCSPCPQPMAEIGPVKLAGEALHATVNQDVSSLEKAEADDYDEKAAQVADADLNHKKKQVRESAHPYERVPSWS